MFLIFLLVSGLWLKLTCGAIALLQQIAPDPVVFGLLSWLGLSLGFWIPAIIYEVARARGWWKRWEFDTNARPPLSLREKAIKQAIISEFLRPVPLCLLGYYVNITMKYEDIPSSPLTWFFQLYILEAIGETWFYWFHRAMHTKRFYPFHKQHHGFVAPIGISAQYVSMVEGLLTGVIPTVLPLFLVPAITGEPLCFQLVLFVFTFRSWWAVDSHCGYAVPWSFGSWLFNDNSHHYWHHKRNIGNYGSVFVPWDALMGTDKEWREARKQKLI